MLVRGQSVHGRHVWHGTETTDLFEIIEFDNYFVLNTIRDALLSLNARVSIQRREGRKEAAHENVFVFEASRRELTSSIGLLRRLVVEVHFERTTILPIGRDLSRDLELCQKVANRLQIRFAVLPEGSAKRVLCQGSKKLANRA